MKTTSNKPRRMALAVAALAVAISAGAAAFAATPPLSKAIKGTVVVKGSEPGDRLILDSVTGKEVKESKLGQVAKATAADTAGSATSATHADSATTATTASAVGGQSATAVRVHCPAGTTASSGACVETGAAHAAATWASAIATCASAGGRSLPTPAQLEQFRVGAGQTGTEWTNDLFATNAAYTVDMATGAVSDVLVSTTNPFRCVVGASN